jgi:hypothetical protein
MAPQVHVSFQEDENPHEVARNASAINAGWTNELTLSEKLDRECEANFALRMELLKKDEALQVKNSQAMCSPSLESNLNTRGRQRSFPDQTAPASGNSTTLYDAIALMRLARRLPSTRSHADRYTIDIRPGR